MLFIIIRRPTLVVGLQTHCQLLILQVKSAFNEAKYYNKPTSM